MNTFILRQMLIQVVNHMIGSKDLGFHPYYYFNIGSPLNNPTQLNLLKKAL